MDFYIRKMRIGKGSILVGSSDVLATVKVQQQSGYYTLIGYIAGIDGDESATRLKDRADLAEEAVCRIIIQVVYDCAGNGDIKLSETTQIILACIQLKKSTTTFEPSLS